MQRCHVFAIISLVIYGAFAWLIVMSYFNDMMDIQTMVIMVIILTPYLLPSIQKLITPCGSTKFCNFFTYLSIVVYIIMLCVIVYVVAFYEVDIDTLVYMFLLIIPYLLYKLEYSDRCEV